MSDQVIHGLAPDLAPGPWVHGGPQPVCMADVSDKVSHPARV